MVDRTLLLMCMTIFIFTETTAQQSCNRMFSFDTMSRGAICPLMFCPVCGSDCITYHNECLLCLHRLNHKADIRIMQEGPCITCPRD
ncbi:probable pancreatic secretory proteinase inhibitor [Hippoglossus stenolepis]|uniref:probable pancreatic secretory proteinase inhibitor n=1 Tax=Hippoglossus stenolepis TaxID=195615 RepID=UPI001FAFD7D6|nr:probable pancreatic secretory proteinase inhibitor [Hippoglossus stenolepis]